MAFRHIFLFFALKRLVFNAGNAGKMNWKASKCKVAITQILSLEDTCTQKDIVLLSKTPIEKASGALEPNMHNQLIVQWDLPDLISTCCTSPWKGWRAMHNHTPSTSIMSCLVPMHIFTQLAFYAWQSQAIVLLSRDDNFFCHHFLHFKNSLQTKSSSTVELNDVLAHL